MKEVIGETILEMAIFIVTVGYVALLTGMFFKIVLWCVS